MKAADQLIKEIREAFADVPFPSRIGLHACRVVDEDWISDDAILREITAQRDYIGEWWDVPKEHLHECLSDLCFLDPDGIAFYFPAHMTAIVEAPETFDVPRVRSSSWHFLWIMQPHEAEADESLEQAERMAQHFYSQLSKISGDKKSVCCSFLLFVADCAACSEEARGLAAVLLAHPFWSIQLAQQSREHCADEA